MWEVVREVISARAAEPDLTDDELLEMLEENAGVARRMVRTALEYWGAYPDEANTLVEYADRVEAEHIAAAERATSLLAR